MADKRACFVGIARSQVDGERIALVPRAAVGIGPGLLYSIDNGIPGVRDKDALRAHLIEVRPKKTEGSNTISSLGPGIVSQMFTAYHGTDYATGVGRPGGAGASWGDVLMRRYFFDGRSFSTKRCDIQFRFLNRGRSRSYARQRFCRSFV